MSRDAAWIVSTFHERKREYAPHRARAAAISATYEGDVSVQLPEMDITEHAAVANLLTQGLDQLAMRIASVPPQVLCPPLRPGFKASENNARIRRLAIGSWWDQNNWDRKERKRARWLIGYAGAPVVLRPNRKLQIPTWELRDPLCHYPAPCAEADDILPDDSIFELTRSFGWIQKRYPAQARALNVSSNPNPAERWNILEFIDADEHVMVAVGKPQQATGSPWGQRNAPQGAPYVELERFPNLVGRCTVVNPTRLSLNEPRGQFDQMPALYQMQARAMSLWLLSTERSIFPDVWFVSRPSEVVTVVERPDGRAGIPGLVKGGDLHEVTSGPPPQVGTVIDLLERNQRTTAGLPSEFGGETATNVRTGKAGDQLMKQTVDYWVQEAQETLGSAHTEENKLAIALQRAYFGSARKSFFVSFKGIKGTADYTPLVNLDSDANKVAWPFAGSDANMLKVRIGQSVGIKEMSIRTAQELDPDIDDPDLEHDRILGESMEQALLAALDQGVASGQITVDLVAEMHDRVSSHKETLFEAYKAAQAQMQQNQQASPQQPPMGAGGPPGGPSGPGGPGGMQPGEQQMLGVGPNNPPGGGVPTPTPGIQHMSQLLGALRPRK